MKHTARIYWVAVMFLAGLAPAFAFTNDYSLTLMAGGLVGYGTRASTYGWSFSYMDGFAEHWAWSISKVNEGHDEDHHRDGSTVQLWGRTFAAERRLMLAAGVGPHFYCDTTHSTEYAQGYENNHGPGVMLSALGRWQMNKLWSLELRANTALNRDKVDTTAIMFGVGHSYEAAWIGDLETRPANIKLNEATALGGVDIVNSFGSEQGGAASLEYRRYFLPWLNVTLAGLYEHGADKVDRRGVAPQLWYGRHFSNGHLSMGFGIGPYLAYDSHREDQPQLAGNWAVSGLVSYTAAWHFDSGWLVRGTWHRVATAYNYNRDADIILAGVGRGF